MSNAKRPAAVKRVHTRTTEANRNAALDQGLRMTIEGETYEARIGDVTPEIARELRRQTGMGFMGMMTALQTDTDIDLISAFVWVARRLRGEYVAFEDVSVSYAALLAEGFDITSPGAEEVAIDDPEA